MSPATAVVDPDDVLHVENIVASARIDQEIDLESLAFDLPGVDYEDGRFPDLVYRSQEPEASVLIFRSGKIVTLGTRSMARTRVLLTDLFRRLSALGIETPDDPAPTIQNMVSSADLGEQIDLNTVAIGIGLENVEYDPEQFPGLVYRIEELGIVALLFGTGKAVITGAMQREDASRAFDYVRSQLRDIEVLG